jgi:xanthine dehydrogenase YagS FAD-binding subunit
MKNFTYYQPSTTAEAIGLLEKTWGKAELLAGGTDLLDLQKEYIAQPEKVISLSGIKDFDTIATTRDPAKFTIGAGTKLATIAANKGLQESCMAVTMAAGMIGGPQIRNMGTLGGNLCQRNRCWYFRDEHVNCLLKGGTDCFALVGENRYHSVFTKGHKCVIVNPSTLAPALIALGALVHIGGDEVKMSLSEFFKAPSAPGEREHILKPNQMVLSVIIMPKEGQKSASYEVRHKQSYDWPLVQAAVAFTLDGDMAKRVKIVLGHVAPIPHIAEAAAKAIEGKAITEKSASEAGEAAAEGAKPLGQNEYKVKLIAVAVKRALLTAAGAKRYWEA